MNPPRVTRDDERARPEHRAWVAFVGAGPGDPGLVTLRARDLLAAADVVVVDHVGRHDLVSLFARPEVTVVDAGHGRLLAHTSLAKLLVTTAQRAPRGGLVVRLMEGDPALFTGLAEEALALTRAGVRFEVVPGVSAMTAVPAYAGVPLTNQSTRSVLVVSADGGTVRDYDWSPAVPDHVTVVLFGYPDRLGPALGALRTAGRAGSTPVAVTEHGTTTRQRTTTCTLDDAEAVVGRVVGFPALAVVGSTVTMRDELSWFETKPLFGWRVLVPRTMDQAGGTVARLASYGATAEVVPTIAVEPPRTAQQMSRAVTGLVTGRYEWIGFTSVNAVRAVREKLEELGVDARALAGLRIAAVGGVTAAALRDWGLVPDLVPEGEQSAAGLLEVWPDYDRLVDPINRVFLPRADIATETLVAGLVALGWEVDDVTAYRTVRAAPPPAPVREAIKVGAFDAVVFTSSSTVRNLVGIAGKPHPATVVACIGPATARTAEELGLRVDVVAPVATSDALVDALAGHGAGLAQAARDAGLALSRPSERRPTARRRAR